METNGKLSMHNYSFLNYKIYENFRPSNLNSSCTLSHQNSSYRNAVQNVNINH